MQEQKSRFPDALTLLLGCILAAALLTWVIPAGEYDRREDAATGRQVVVAGSYHAVERNAVGPFELLVAIPRGMEEAASIIFLVFLVGGGITVVDRTGVLRRGVNSLVSAGAARRRMAVPLVCAIFAAGGALEGMSEEVVAVVPALLVLARRLGYAPVTVVAMSLGSAAVGAAFSPMNPFGVGIAQKLSDVALLSGWQFRLLFLLLAVTLWVLGIVRYGARVPLEQKPEDSEVDTAPLSTSDAVLLILVLGCFAGYVAGVLRLDWGFEQMSALFFLLGVLAGLAGGLRIRGTVDAFVDGFRSMAYAAVLIGFARAIYVVLNDGRIIDSIVHALFQPVSAMPGALAAGSMLLFQTALHVPVPSTSGQAVLTLPILVPLSDLSGIARQVTVLAYQYGAGLCDLITPTNGSLMAVLAAAGVRYDKWFRFVLPLFALMLALGLAAVVLAGLVGLQ